MNAYPECYVNEIVEMPEGGYSMFSLYLRDKDQQTKAAMAIEARIRQDSEVNPEINVTSRLEAMKKYPTNVGKGIEKQVDPKKPENEWKGVKYAVETLYDEIPQIKTVLNIVHIITTVILIVILMIVMVGVSNTYRMVLYERIREIGTMRALGMTGKDVQDRLNKVNELAADIDELQGDSATSIQGKLTESIRTHDGSSSAHPNLVRAGTSDAKEYEAYKGKNTVEDIVGVIRGEINSKITSIGAMTSEDIKKAIKTATEDAISNHNNSTDGIHTFLVDKITTAKTELTQEIKTVKDLIDDEETGLKVRVAKLEGDFITFDATYVDNDELTARLSNEVFGFEPTDSTYGSYTIKTLKDESDTRFSQTNADIAKIKVKAEEARTTANEANQTAANAYDAVTTIIQNKAEKTEVQLLNTKLDTEIAKNTREHEAINKKINDDLAAAKIEIDGKITQAVEDAKYNLGLVDTQLQGQIDDVKERIQNLGSNESSINTRLSAAETDISELNIKINGLDNTYATDAALESVKSDLEALETKESQDITNLTNTINALKGSDVAEDVTISSIDSKVNTLTSDLETYKGEVNSSIANINTSIGELTSADEQINTSLDSKLSKTTQIQSFGNVFNSEAE